MASASGIRAGKAFVELMTKDVNFSKGLKSAQKQLSAFGMSVRAIGGGLSGIGRGLLDVGGLVAAPLALATKSFIGFEDAMASLRAAANPTADQLEKIKTAVTAISKETGFGPAKVAAAMTELLKAGMPLEQVLSGATTAAIQFAKVAEMDVAEAATVLTDAMNVFGQSATDTVDVISRAADASSISVRDVAMSFAMASAVAKQAGLSIGDVANAIAILGQNGVKGSDAGTSLKTMLLRLLAPADEGAKAIAALGINVRQANGQMKPLRGIIAELQKKLGGLGAEARDQAMKDIFGTDAIRAGAILIGKGTDGWDEFNKKMGEGLPVAQKFGMLMDTLSGHGAKALAAIERLSITVGQALMPAFRSVSVVMTDFANAVEIAAKANPGLIVDFLKMAAGAAAAGAALVAVGASLGTVASVVVALSTPLGMLTAAVGAGALAWLKYTESGQKAIADFLPTVASMKDTAVQTFGAIANALKAGDLALAGKIFWAGLKVEWLKGTQYLMGVWDDFKAFASDVWAGIGFELQKVFINASSAVQKTWALLVESMKSMWSGSLVEMTKNLVSFLAPVETIFAKALGIDVNKVIEGALGNLGIREGDAEKKQREEARSAGQKRIEDQRQAAITGVDEAQRNDQDARRSARMGDPEAIRRKAELDAAQKELSDLSNQAAAGVPPVLTPDSGGGANKGTAAKPEMPTEEDLAQGVNAAAKKVDVKGTFNAAALGRLGAGDSVSSKLEQQIKATEKVEKQVEKLNDKARQGKLVFGA